MHLLVRGVQHLGPIEGNEQHAVRVAPELQVLVASEVHGVGFLSAGTGPGLSASAVGGAVRAKRYIVARSRWGTLIYMHAHTSNSYGEALVDELKWVHGLIRRDLISIRELAADLENGLSAGDAVAAVRSLEVSGPLWRLKINCLQYCRFVHAHHHAESALLFPRLRRSNPALGPVVDKLEADHAVVSDLLDDVSAVAADLASQEEPTTRKRLIDALGDLSAVLLAHLDYEEEHIADTLRTWAGWGW